MRFPRDCPRGTISSDPIDHQQGRKPAAAPRSPPAGSSNRLPWAKASRSSASVEALSRCEELGVLHAAVLEAQQVAGPGEARADARHRHVVDGCPLLPLHREHRGRARRAPVFPNHSTLVWWSSGGIRHCWHTDSSMRRLAWWPTKWRLRSCDAACSLRSATDAAGHALDAEHLDRATLLAEVADRGAPRPCRCRPGCESSVVAQHAQRPGCRVDTTAAAAASPHSTAAARSL